MTQENDIRKELQKRNEETRQKISREKAEQEFNEYMDDLGIDRIDAEKNTRRMKK